ncbi:MAG: Spermidine/putrescine import ATP-binding protein PotA [Anaerolineales bacterium]|nr:Spermidine/putrescine import ATP-binding protein PotA [Anaerolineales bacterium]
MTEVCLHGLNKIFRGGERVHAVKDFDLEIASGKITALLGPSGCGKTTTLKMIAGLLRPTSGDITFDGKSMLSIPAERRGVAMVFQNYLLFPYMSVGENVGFGLRMRHVDKDIIQRKVAEMLELVRLPGYEARRPKQLSGGQQQRVALARALIIEPDVLLLDEPISNLDAHLRDEMRELILGIQRQLGITTIFVTHDQEEAVVLADGIALIFGGQLHQFDEPNVFYERPASAKIARFFGGVNFLEGVKHGEQVETPLGDLYTNHQNIGDGPVLVTARPENLELGAEGENTVQARIRSHVYVGTHSRFKVQAENWEFEVVAEASTVQKFQDGEVVPLKFPREKIWLVRSEEQ